MPPNKRQRVQSTRTTRQSTRQRGKPEDEIPDVYGEMLAEAAAEVQVAASKPKPSNRQPIRTTRRSTRQRGTAEDDIPDVYGEMLAEAVAEEQAAASNARSSKRRKMSEEPSSKIELDIDLFGGPNSDNPTPTEPTEEEAPKIQQVILNDFDASDESDVEFEDVDLEPTAEEDFEDDESEQKTLELDLSKPITPQRAAQKRKPVSAAEKRLRLDVHKAHIVVLLAHLTCRNRWSNSESVHSILKPLVPRKIISLLHVDEAKPQYQRNQSFTEGIEELCNIWKEQWTINGRGLQRAYWRDDVDAVKESDDAEDLSFDEFKAAAVSREGSRDLAAQLFCALLRTVALDARLVCSLQVLPFSGVARGQTPEKVKPDYIFAPPQSYNSTPGTSTSRRKWFSESMYPIFWVEVFSPAVQTWIPLDPIVRHTINKPKTGFEPPSSDNQNRLTYVVAFEDDGSAKDVTRRYTQFYNSKTRKQRVESTQGGEKWWSRTMRVFENPFQEPRDEIEDAFLQKRVESEPMPRNIQDFRGHSVYVLERHLHLNQVIHPKREVGKVSTGPMKTAKLESVYRRRDVHVCRTADSWYRRGRDVSEGEQPLKRVMPKRKRTPVADDLDDEEAAEGTALYAEYQTSMYEPPPVVDGKIPRNAYGNLDVYVPSMIPAGAVHIRHPLASKAARILGIDYADAVTGFQFKGRQGTAVIDGVVVSMKMTNAMITVIEGLESQATEEVQEARSKAILAMWKRWLTALRVREHVRRQYGDREEGTKAKAVEVDDEEEDATYRPGEDGGGFMLEDDEPDENDKDAASRSTPSKMLDVRPLDQLLPPEIIYQEIIVVKSPNSLPQPPLQDLPQQQSVDKDDPTYAAEGGGFLPDEDNDAGGFLPEDEDTTMTSRQPAPSDPEPADQEGGGFLPDDENKGGGFLSDSEDPEPRARVTTTHGASMEEGQGAFPPETANDSTTTAAAVNATASAGSGNSDPDLRNSTSDEQTAEPTQSRHHHAATGSTQPPENATESTVAPAAKEHAGQSGQATPSQIEAPNANARTPASASASTPGSLLSHDPEEDDAEPEWLLNSLGEMD